MPSHSAPGVPGDPEDRRRDREADQRIGNREAKHDDDCGGDYGQADVGVGAGMIAIGDQGRAVEAVSSTGADARRDPVAGESDQPCGGQGEAHRPHSLPRAFDALVDQAMRVAVATVLTILVIAGGPSLLN